MKQLHNQKGYGAIAIICICVIVVGILYFLYPFLYPRKEENPTTACYIPPEESTTEITGEDGNTYVLIKPFALTIKQQVGYHFQEVGKATIDDNEYPMAKVILDSTATMNNPPLPPGFIIHTQPGRPEGGTYRPATGAEHLRFVDRSSDYPTVDHAYSVIYIFLLKGEPVPAFIKEYCSNQLSTKSLTLFQDTNNVAIPNLTINSGDPSEWAQLTGGAGYNIAPRPNITYGMFAYDKKGSNSFALSTGQIGIPISKKTYIFSSNGETVTYNAYFLINSSTETITLVNTDPQAADADIGYKYTPAEFAPNLNRTPDLNKYVNDRFNPSLHWQAFVPFQVPPWGWWTPECKPAIYLYPEKAMPVNVKVRPQGFLTYTEPLYNSMTGWNVFADPSGTVTTMDHKQFEYLYYESKILDHAIQKPKNGYIIAFDHLEDFYTSVLPNLGLNKKETNDYITYWMKYLPKADFYFIGIMDKQSINAIEPLTIQPSPKTNIRVRLYYQALTREEAEEKQKTIQEPTLTAIPERQGFTMVEWGGMVKRDKNHPFTCSQ